MKSLNSCCAVLLTALGLVFGASAPVRAATCTIAGTLQIQPMDSYYCDTGWVSYCGTGWKETDLDVATKPMKYLYVSVHDAVSGALVGYDYTDTSGGYSVTFSTGSPPTCTGSGVWEVRFNFARVHEDDTLAVTPRYRFRVTGFNSGTSLTWANNWVIGLSGPTTTFSYTYPRTPDGVTEIANVYYTAASSVTEMETWSTNLSNQLASTSGSNGGILRIRYDPTVADSAAAFQSDWRVDLDDDDYNRGGIIRHELGHIAHFGLHSRNQSGICQSYIFNNGNTSHNELSCEYGYAAAREGIASFIAARSITDNDTNVWTCWCSDPNNTATGQSTCSQAAAAADGVDNISFNCAGPGGYGWTGIGDTFSSLVTHCARIQPDAINSGCNCTDTSPQNGICDSSTWYQTNGFRSEAQISRFLWDMIDANNEGGTDDTDRSMGQLAGDFQAMTCNAGSGYNSETCNEPDRASAGSCVPTNGQVPGTAGSGTRDAYNAWDLGDIIPGSQSSERTRNCVQGAVE
jgi:hypothetical protein